MDQKENLSPGVPEMETDESTAGKTDESTAGETVRLQAELLRVATRFSLPGLPESAVPEGRGYINHTYRVEVRTTASRSPDRAAGPNPAGGDTGGLVSFILQRINTSVFREPRGLMENFCRVTEHLAGKPDAGACVRVVSALDGRPYVEAEDGSFWRMITFIPDSISFDRVPDERIAREGGAAVGRFQAGVSDLTGPPLHETIPRFHDVGWRIAQFEEAVAADSARRAGSVSGEIGAVRARAGEMLSFMRSLSGSGVPLRTVHNDTKINNILFHRITRKALCMIDLDTVMPGYACYDFGDCIRTAANTGEEDDENLSRISLDMGTYASFTEGYLSEAGTFLQPGEIESLPFSPRLFTFLMAIRFLTDHLAGDRYYRIDHPGHNLRRARAQLALITDMEWKADEMKRVVAEAAARVR